GPRSALYDALETASGAQEDPLSIVISTQAPTNGDLLSILIDDAQKAGDPETKLFMWSAPEDIDPFSRKAMKAANPGRGDVRDEDEGKRKAEAASRMPARQSADRNLGANQRVTQVSPLIPLAIWHACGGEPSEEAFPRGKVRIGLDLSARHDLTA